MKRLLILSIVFFLSQQSVSTASDTSEEEHPAEEEPSYNCSTGWLGGRLDNIYLTMCTPISENEENDNSS